MRRRYTYRAHHIGRLRRAAADILSRGVGFQIDPDDIKPATGSWRTRVENDVYRWELFTRDSRGMPIVAGCWFTLTDFVKHAKKEGWHFDRDGEIVPGKAS
mgnify:CR=1 FL=1